MSYAPTWAAKHGEPRTSQGQPLYFYPAHNQWLEQQFHLAPNTIAGIYNRNLSQQAAHFIAEVRMTGAKHNVHTGEIVFTAIEDAKKEERRRQQNSILAGDPTGGIERRGATRQPLRNQGFEPPVFGAGLARRGAVKEGVAAGQKRPLQGTDGSWYHGGIRKSARLSQSNESGRPRY